MQLYSMFPAFKNKQKIFVKMNSHCNNGLIAVYISA